MFKCLGASVIIHHVTIPFINSRSRSLLFKLSMLHVTIFSILFGLHIMEKLYTCFILQTDPKWFFFLSKCNFFYIFALQRKDSLWKNFFSISFHPFLALLVFLCCNSWFSLVANRFYSLYLSCYFIVMYHGSQYHCC